MAPARNNLAHRSKTHQECRCYAVRTDACVRAACPPVAIGQIAHSRCQAPKNAKVVAIVDDEPVLLDAVDRMLRSVGYSTELFTSGEAYLANAGTSAAACLVSDVNLEGISGIELRRQLVADGAPIPTILMSADSNHATETAAIASGCVAFLRKPFPISSLLAAVEAACAAAS